MNCGLKIADCGFADWQGGDKALPGHGFADRPAQDFLTAEMWLAALEEARAFTVAFDEIGMGPLMRGEFDELSPMAQALLAFPVGAPLDDGTREFDLSGNGEGLCHE